MKRSSRLRQATRKVAMIFLMGSALLIVSGCSSFNREWKKSSGPVPTNSIAGRWDGSWRSEVNGHNGGLRCLMTPSTNGFFTARFHATYKWGFLPLSGSYRVPLSVQRNGDHWEFAGDSDLGWLGGGQYRYRGTATSTNFFSTYDSKHDRGVFQMTRPN